MHFKYIPYLWVLAMTFFTVMVIGLFAIIYHRVRGAKLFGLCMLFFGFWIICKGTAMISADYYTRNFWSSAAFCLYVALHTSWFFMVLQFGGKREWLNLGKIIPILIIPVLTMILVWTREYSDLSYFGFYLDVDGYINLASKPNGWLLLLSPAYTYTLDIIAIVLVMQKTLFYKSIYGMKMSSFLLGPMISISPTMLYIFSFWLIKGYDIAVIFMGITSVVAAAGGYHLFVSAPIAREAAVDNINIAIIVVNNYGNIADVNNAARAMFEIKKKKLLGSVAESTLSSLSTELCDLENNESREIEVANSKSGQKRYLRAQRMPITNKKGVDAGYVILISDVTELWVERVRMLQQNSTVVANKERAKLARDLHDNLAQVLASISLQAQGICNELEYEESGKVYRDLTRLVDISQSAHREIREYITSVRGTIDPEMKLPEAARDVLSDFRAQTKLAVSTQFSDIECLDRLTTAQKENVFYIMKESLNNIRKHARGAKNVQIVLGAKDDRLHFSIEDDGAGFDCNKEWKNKYGLMIMRERAAEIGASITIESHHGKGTRIEVGIPFAEGGYTNV